jgi:hypothetical protein
VLDQPAKPAALVAARDMRFDRPQFEYRSTRANMPVRK